MKVSEVQMFPSPKFVSGNGEEYALKPSATAKHPAFQEKAELLNVCFYKMYDITLQKDAGGIELYFDASIQKGAYRIESDQKMSLYASDDEGMFYAIASALLLIDIKKGVAYTKKLTINDYADKGYRSFMLSMPEGGMSLAKIKNFVDICFIFKVNHLHLHLSDNIYYCFPSKVLSKLPTSESAFSFEEMEELNTYAKERGVIIVPEIDLPGHAASITTRCPEIFANQYEGGDTKIMYSEAGTIISGEELICVGSKKSMEYVFKLIDEICEIFPDSPYIHLGGDEADIEAWNNCPVCRQYMKDEAIEDVHELYSDFIARVCKQVLKNGRTPIVWEGFPKKGAERIPKETIVCAWECYYYQPEDLLDAGFRIINGSWQPLYIVQSQTERWTPLDIMKWDVYNLQHFWTESRAHLNPVHLTPTENVLGGQISSWGCFYELCMGRAIENLPAMCERLWTVERVCSDTDFYKKHGKVVMKAAKLISKSF